jgi:hypothetical protein
MNFKDILAKIEQYSTLIVLGVHAANSVPDASNADKKAVVLATVVATSDAIAASLHNPTASAIGIAVDVVASVVNALIVKSAATPAAVAPVAVVVPVK